jgi:predicted NBD/HSP70 family sugar kinase
MIGNRREQSAGIKTGDAHLIKSYNRALILNELRSQHNVSRASIAKATGLNKATVSTQVAELIDQGLVVEVGTDDSQGGRKPVLLEFDERVGYFVGLSLNEQEVRVTVRSLCGKELGSVTERVGSRTPDGIAEVMIRAIDGAIAGLIDQRSLPLGIGLALPGVIDSRTQRIVRSAHLDWENVDVVRFLNSHYACPIHVENDANLATLAENSSVNAEGSMLCVFLDEGVGAGLILGKQLYRGSNGYFGEVGHMTIVHNGKRCSCGNLGCWDAYASENALNEMLSAEFGGNAPSIADAAEMARSGDQRADAIFSVFVDYIASGLVSLINVFSPTTTIVNSRVLEICPEYFARLSDSVKGRVLPYNREYTIQPSQLGTGAPVIGASMMAMDRFLEDVAETPTS